MTELFKDQEFVTIDVKERNKHFNIKEKEEQSSSATLLAKVLGKNKEKKEKKEKNSLSK
jgi:hypothetical protein